MRAGERARPWTVAEERRLRELAGSVPRREVAWALRRSNEAVRQKAKRMGVSLRFWRPRCSQTCPRCGMARHSMGRSGACRPCELRDLIARADADTAEAMARLPQDARATYQRTEAHTMSGVPPKPPEPDTEGMTPYRAAKARDEWALAMERWDVDRLTRVLKAKRRRVERMRKKIPNQ